MEDYSTSGNFKLLESFIGSIFDHSRWKFARVSAFNYASPLVLVSSSTPKSKSSKRNDASILISRWKINSTCFCFRPNLRIVTSEQMDDFRLMLRHFLPLLIPSFSRECKNKRNGTFILSTVLIHYSKILSHLKKKRKSLTMKISLFLLFQGNAKLYVYNTCSFQQC